MKKVTFLGPVGATFSHDAYNILAEIYGAPKVGETNYIQADSNSEVLRLVLKHGGYGAIAMETLAEGRVAEPVESFIELLKTYKKTESCPFHVVGAVHLKLHFCLMVRSGMTRKKITKVIAHPKALGACKDRIMKLGVPTENSTSNGEAARLVASDEKYANCAALGPHSAAEKYGLKILSEAFEDEEAITTFFLVAPIQHKVSVGKENRMLIVFEAPHEPGSLVKTLQPFADEGLNLIQIHSVHVGNRAYNFAIEIEISDDKLLSLARAMAAFKKYVDTHLSFGPFEVLSK